MGTKVNHLNKYNEKTKMNVTLNFTKLKTNRDIIAILSDSYISKLLSIFKLFRRVS